MTNFSPEQSACIDAYAAGENLSICAVAGAGKTTTLVGMANANKTPTLALVFNKCNAEEMAARFGTHVECKTLNALGHRIWGQHLGKRLTLDPEKSKSLLSKFEIARAEFGNYIRAIDFLRSNGYVPEKVQGAYRATGQDMQSLLTQIDLDHLDESILDEAITAGIQRAYAGTIDFTDQLYMPVMAKAAAAKHLSVLVDEAQDLSNVQHELVAKVVAKRITVVGDPCQAIYAWRGASSSSFDEMTDLFSLRRMMLSVSFRCPQAIVHEAQRYVSYIQPTSSAPVGSVQELDELPEHLPPDSAVVCRLNAPLVSKALQLVRRNQGFVYLGRSFLTGIKRVIAAAPTTALLERWYEAEILKSKSDSRRAIINDRYMAMKVLYEGGNPEQAINKLLVGSANPHATKLSTIHKAKGLEWKNVYWLDAKNLGKNQGTNLAYVAITRAKENLFYVKAADNGE